MNPILPMEYMLLISAAVVVAGGILGWRSSEKATTWLRVFLSILRVAALVALGVLAFDVGYWRVKQEKSHAEWAVMLDVSASMNVKDVVSESRFNAAGKLAAKLAKGRENVEIFPFDSELRSLARSKSDASPFGSTALGGATDIARSCASLLRKRSETGQKLKGVVILSDGRETVSGDKRISLLARAEGTPLYGVCFGGDVPVRDLSVDLPRTHYTLFAGQEQQISVTVKNRGLGNIKTKVAAHDDNGATLDEKEVELNDGTSKTITFRLKLKQAGFHELWVQASCLKQERSWDDNRRSIVVSVIDEKLNVLMIEGIPFWDGKFLSRILRENQNINLTGIYRLTPERFFRISEEDGETRESGKAIFPDSMDRLSKYSLIVFGKGAEFFLNESRIKLLRSYIRDFGGAVLFARGKPYSGDWSGLRTLEPVEWGEPISAPLRWSPTRDGVESGLFGEMLPGPGSSIWRELPSVETAFACRALRGFSKVLIRGEFNSTRNASVPILITRRLGRGVVIAVNGEGLWKWDFFPLKGETGDFYKDFWTQLVFWAAKYADFLPNQDFALNLSATIVDPGAMVAVVVNSRHKKLADEENISIEISKGAKVVKRIVPASSPRGGVWRGVFAMDSPGTYRVSLRAPG
ncbi:MAG: hypothetical protein GXP32_09805, partial [Kiritimatiellaeota bacterium]|nr:hypothetical protein [Kiritimatiellota bacterium]